MNASEPDRDHVADVLASAILEASDHELAEHAAAAGEDIDRAADELRARFLERVEFARRFEPQADPETLDDDSQPPLSVRETAPIAEGSSDAEPTRIGRYPLLRRLGSGGMGVVYAAYDELLDRRVALKVLHTHVWDVDGRRRERLLREAQAMARVAHPNVVTVHEVGTTDDQLFVAMEFIAGPTLEGWLSERRRSWREIVEMFRQVADGLAALHEVGLVHRDVKPANVIVGLDGRARVLDLGLVGADELEFSTTSPPSLESSGSLNRLQGSLTRTGEFVGTPAYMSREQFLGLELTPASDIFSFSVALFEALYGVHPFMARTFHELQSNVIDCRVKPAPSSSSVPTWLHNLVLRGLAPDPKDRPPSMQWLSAELAKDPARVRRRRLGTLGFALAAGLAGVLITRAQLEAPSTPMACDGAEATMEKVWSEAQAERVRAGMAQSSVAYAAPLATRVVHDLDAYAEAWIEAHRRACQEHAHGEHSAALLDARVTCLDRRRLALSETVGLLAVGGPEVVARAGQMTAHLPRIEACDDLTRLAGERLPSSPELATKVVELDARLIRAKALAAAGRGAEAIELARDVAHDAESIGYAPTHARALLDQAEIALTLPEVPEPAAALDRALTLAIEEQLDALAAEAMTRRLHVRAMSGQAKAALADIPVAEAMVERAGGDLELRALLFNNAGTIQLAAGHREAARVDFERALELKRQAFGDEHLDIALGLANLSMLSDDPTQRQRLQQQMLEIYDRRLGPKHPRTLDARFLTAMYTADPEQAATMLRDVCPLIVDGGEARLAGECERARGRLAYLRDQPAIVSAAFASLRSIHDADPTLLVLADAYLALGRDEPTHAAALEALRALIDSFDGDSHSEKWWIRLEQAERRLVLADMLATSSEPERVDQLERALVELESVRDDAPPIELERLLARVQIELARALADADTTPSRARDLREQGRAHYQRWPRAYASQLVSLDTLETRPPN